MFRDEIKQYLEGHNWVCNLNDGKSIFAKQYSNQKGSLGVKHKHVALNQVVNIIKTYHANKGIEESHFDTVINPYTDTDYIIAALQIINKYKFKDIPYTPSILFSLQPCIRPIPSGKTINDGFLHAFVNVGTIAVGQSKVTFFEILEDWITIFSKCSIHISRIQLVMKDMTNAYSGGGLSVYVDGIEVGQANFYSTQNVLDVEEDSYVFDFGFGVERITWASNWFDDFNYIYQCKEDYYYRRDGKAALVNQIVLLIISGVRPNSSKFGLKLKALFEQLVKEVNISDLNTSIKFAYEYWMQFIKPAINYSDLMEIWNSEMNYLRNVRLSEELGMSSSNKQLRTDSCLFCDNLFNQGFRRK